VAPDKRTVARVTFAIAIPNAVQMPAPRPFEMAEFPTKKNAGPGDNIPIVMIVNTVNMYLTLVQISMY